MPRSRPIRFAGDANSGVPAAVIDSTVDNLYVALDGKDTNAGTISSPFATLEGAKAGVAAKKPLTKDVVVWLRGGTHRLTSTFALTTADSGTKDYSVTYKQFPNETAVISGSTLVTSKWSVHSGSIYKTTLVGQADFRTLFVNGTMATRARWPDKGSYHVQLAQPGINSPVVYDHFLLDTSITSQLNLPAGHKVEAVNFNDFIIDRHRVALVAGQRVFTQESSLSGFNSRVKYNKMYFENSLDFLTAPGEWYYDPTATTLYYWPLAGEDMATAVVEVPIVEELVTVKGTGASLPAQSGNFTISLFFKTDYTNASDWRKGLYDTRYAGTGSAPFGVEVSLAKDATNEGYIVVHYNQTDIKATAQTGLNDNAWHNLIVSFNATAGTVDIIIDGANYTPASNTISGGALTAPPRIGRGITADPFWSGGIARVIVLNTTINPASDDVTDIIAQDYTEMQSSIVYNLPLKGNFELACDTIQGQITERLVVFNDAPVHSKPALTAGGPAGLENTVTFDGVNDWISGEDYPGEYVENVRFENLTFEKTDWPDIGTGWGFDNQRGWEQQVPGAITFQYVRDYAVEGCEIRNTQLAGVWADRCSSGTFKNNHIHDVGDSGIVLDGFNDFRILSQHRSGGNLIRDNHIHDIGGNSIASSCIWTRQTSDTNILWNELYNSTRVAIHVYTDLSAMHRGHGEIEIAYNKIRNTCQVLGDASAIYGNGRCENSRIHHNFIKDVLRTPDHAFVRPDQDPYVHQMRGIYLDEGATGWTVDRNLVIRCAAQCFFSHIMGVNTIENNIFAYPLDPSGAAFTENIAKIPQQDPWERWAFWDLYGVKALAIGSTVQLNIFAGESDDIMYRLDVSSPAQETALAGFGIGPHDKNLFQADVTGRRTTSETYGSTTQHDLAWLNTSQSIEANSLVADPRFRDAPNDGYHVLSHSPIFDLIGTGGEKFENFYDDLPK